MKVKLNTTHLPSTLELLRKAGYSPFTDPRTGDESYILRLTADYYPRFHLYTAESGRDLELSLHIDQKKPGYKGASRHNAEYDGPVVEREMKRILRWADVLSNQTVKRDLPQKQEMQSKDEPKEKKGLFGGIF